jgi:hypothetical protein
MKCELFFQIINHPILFTGGFGFHQTGKSLGLLRITSGEAHAARGRAPLSVKPPEKSHPSLHFTK